MTDIRKIVSSYSEEDLGETILDISPVDDNLSNWIATIMGPPGTVYQGIKLRVMFEATSEGRIHNVRFYPPLYHPNVDSDSGNICYSVDYDHNMQSYDPIIFLKGLIGLLENPGWDDPEDSATVAIHELYPHLERTAVLISQNLLKTELNLSDIIYDLNEAWIMHKFKSIVVPDEYKLDLNKEDPTSGQYKTKD